MVKVLLQGQSTKPTKKWKIVGNQTKYNCLYTALKLAQNWETYQELLNEPHKLTNMGKQLKKRIKEKFDKSPKKLFSNEVEIQMCSDYLKCPIKVYNNVFRLINAFVPCMPVRDTRTKQREALEIQIVNGHYVALLSRKQLNEPFEEVVECLDNEDAESGDDKDTLIVKRQFETEEHFRYASYDIEATPDPLNNNYHKAYACGFSFMEDGELVHEQFWGLSCQQKFVEYIHSNIKKFNKYTVYAHNGGKYDYPNLFREALRTYNGLEMRNSVELNGRLISFQLTDGDSLITFRDSLCLFANQSLKDITKEMKVKHQKLTELVNHKQINIHNFMTHRSEISKYLTHDCHGLLEVILQFAHNLFSGININLSDVYTGATLSKKTFYKRYYNHHRYPIYYMSKQKDKFVRNTYYGGRNEAFRLGFVKGQSYMYDFTSLYPSVACRYLPYGKPEWVTLNSMSDFNTFYGFTEVYVQTIYYNKKPIHAVLKKCGTSNRLVFPYIEKWTKMTLFSDEIKLGMSSGVYAYKFEKCQGLKFKRAPFMRPFFQDCFKNKADAKKAGNKALAQIYKIIANSGYGFWGLRWCNRECVIFGNKNEIDVSQYLEKGKLFSRCEWNDSKYTTLKVEKDLEMKDFNVAIASAITSLGRMRLWQLINAIEEKGHEVYYCDTDSVITSCDLTKHEDLMKEFIPDKTGDALGSLKNEVADLVGGIDNFDIDIQYNHDDGDICFDKLYICGCKFYAGEKTLYNGYVVEKTKCKGFKSNDENKLSLDAIEQLVEGKMEKVKAKIKVVGKKIKLRLNVINAIEQRQEQWNFPKSSMVDEQRICGLNITPVTKTFTINYKKGILHEDGRITPLTI
jgi:hypothetical protein